MKKTSLAVIAILSALPFASQAQWTTSGSNIYYNTGNVGIGTTSPSGKLHIQTATHDLLTGTYSFDIGLNGTSGGWARSFRVVNTSNSNGQDGGAFGVYGNGATPNYVYMAIPTADETGFNSTKMIMLNNSGNVGIGTTSPGAKLDVQGGNINVYNTGSATSLIVGSGATGKTFLSIGTSADAGGYANLQSVSASGSAYGSLILNGTAGKVGIGTTSPDEKLTVNGTIHSTEIKVDIYVPAPDYVFEPTYKLSSLAEIKTFVDKNHHLPEIPSAAEMAKNGLDLGDMNMKLLKKVEELTLHLIEKDKQLAHQKQISEKIEARLRKLEERTNR